MELCDKDLISLVEEENGLSAKCFNDRRNNAEHAE